MSPLRALEILADVDSEPDQPQFKLDIRSEPIHEEGLDTLSNMASTLRAVCGLSRTRR